MNLTFFVALARPLWVPQYPRDSQDSMSYISARVFTKNIEWSSNSLSSYNVTKIADYIGNTILLYKCRATFRHRREPVRSPGRHPHGGMLARQQAFMLTSSTAPKSPHTPSAPSLRLPPAAQGIEGPAAEQLHLPEKAHARCEQGSELMVCSNAIFGAVCRAVRCRAVRCSEVHSACWLAVLHMICKLVCMQAFSRAWLSGERPRLNRYGAPGVNPTRYT